MRCNRYLFDFLDGEGLVYFIVIPMSLIGHKFKIIFAMREQIGRLDIFFLQKLFGKSIYRFQVCQSGLSSTIR